MIKFALLFYLFGLIIFFAIASIAVRQLLRHRMPNDRARLAIALFSSVVGLILIVSFIGIFGLDWS